MSLNQRGGVQSYYETGDRLVYSSKSDYEDWLVRLSKYSDNINNTTNNLKEGLIKGYTQPKLVTKQVITQIDNLLNNDLDNHPYLKIFLTSNDNYFVNDEKDQLIKDAKELITNKIIPAYQELNTFLKDEYLPQSRDSIGLDGVPNGKEWYEYVARYHTTCLLYTSPSPRDLSTSRMPSSA